MRDSVSTARETGCEFARGGGESERRAGGFTLLELLTVVALISVLMGLGVGVLQRGSNDLSIALSIVRDQMRLAANTAVANGLPTEVHIANEEPGMATRVHVRVLEPVGFWHLESDERWINAALRPELTGSVEPRGRFGEARRPDPESRSSLLTVSAGREGVFYLDRGFAFRLELLLEGRESMAVAKLGRAFEIDLEDGLIPTARVTLAEPGPRPGTVVVVRGQRPLRTGVWVTLEVVHDGRVLSLLIDGEEVARESARGEPFRQPSDLLEVSIGSAPILGLVDEIQLLAYEASEEQSLPTSVQLQDLQGPVRFGRRGELLAPARFTLVQGEESLGRTVAPGGVLRPWKKKATKEAAKGE